jgi:hypothetical protein
MTTISNKVRLYRYSDANAPVLRGQASALIQLLDACLVDGYDPRSVDSITVAAGVATAGISAGHSYEVGAVIRIAGATPAALNGDWRVASATGSELTFSVAGLSIADGAATGTITALRAPAGWQKLYSATNKAVYRSLNHSDHNGQCLRVVDSNATLTRVRGYASMTSVDAGTGPFPTTGQASGDGLYWGKSNASGSSARNWALVADSRRFVFCGCPQSGYPDDAYAYMFGHLTEHHDSDSWAHIISGVAASADAVWGYIGAEFGLHITNASNTNDAALYVARAMSQTSGAVAASCVLPVGWSETGGVNYPTGTIASDLYAAEGVIMDRSPGWMRGRFPGPAHLYAYVSSAGGFDLIGSPGNGALFMRTGASVSLASSYIVNIGEWPE